MKLCNKCNVEKETTQFYEKSGNTCKLCKKAIAKARYAANPTVYTTEQKARKKITQAKYYKDNPDYVRPCRAANPSYMRDYHNSLKLGYWVVYVIRNYNGLKDNYCGQTNSTYHRMKSHASLGKLNTEKFEVIEKFNCIEEAIEFESAMHNLGFHGKNTGGH